MIRTSPRLQEIESRHAAEHGPRSYMEALAVFTGLWHEAEALNPGFPGDWRADLAPDFAIARAVNGLPPHA